MATKRLYSIAAATCIAMAASLTFTGTASAEPDPDPTTLAAQAQAAADTADQAFRDGNWTLVTDSLAEFDAAYAELVALRNAAQSALETDTLAEADAEALFRAAKDEAQRLKDIRDDLIAQRDAARDRRDAALVALPLAEQAVPDAQDALALAQSEFDAAEAAYGAHIATLLGAPSWWTSVVSDPLTVAQLIAAIDSANATVSSLTDDLADAQAALDLAQAALDAETMFSDEWWAARTVRNEARNARNLLALQLIGAQAWLGVLDSAAANPQVQAYDRRDDFFAAQSALTAAQDALAQAEADLVAAQEELAEARAAFQRLRDEVPPAREAFREARDLRDDLRAQWQAALAQLDASQAEFDLLDGLVNGLATAAANVADRKADLVDLATVRSTAVWTMGADNPTPRVGDSVTVNFSVPNSNLFALHDARVDVLSPDGVTPTCDIPADGTVPAGAVVSCSATYVPTDQDAKAGSVTFEVALSGWIPLGPGNPRATAATQTMIVVSHSITMDVAARPVVVASSHSTLAATGADMTQGSVAIMLVLTGVGLLVVRRRLTL